LARLALCELPVKSQHTSEMNLMFFRACSRHCEDPNAVLSIGDRVPLVEAVERTNP